ncbi:MAG: hypothetical protein CVU39_19610 [Chloroflexi bacterium HGW-Chloroflexi-10]|nr:MAG: hypothetical protein CVU39_19610 [Chloroflexi bacterium HGW-Chloroflexi-10]
MISRKTTPAAQFAAASTNPTLDSVYPKRMQNQSPNGAWTKYPISLANRNLSSIVGVFGIVMKSSGKATPIFELLF